MSRTIYEARNEDLKEVFIGTAGATDFSIDNLRTSHQNTPPQAISHWKFDAEKIIYSVVEVGLNEIDVPVFLENYMRSALPLGWTLIVE